jgi:2-oxoglutarate dehydrogenase E1 component
MKHLTFANSFNAGLIDENYAIWKKNPESLDSHWRAFFEGFALANGESEKKHVSEEEFSCDYTGYSILDAYRTWGHRKADLDPLGLRNRSCEYLEASQLGIESGDWDRMCVLKDFGRGQPMTTRALVKELEKIYCGSIGYQYMHIGDRAQRDWLSIMIEQGYTIHSDEKKKALEQIVRAEMFEHFLHTRFVGQKRFSLEGGEAIVAGVESIIEQSLKVGIKKVVIGMAHRGRLNFLVNIMGKPLEKVFREFSESYIPDIMHGDGDVKYHMGYDNQREYNDKKIGIHLGSNPSHLEAVNPVIQGKVRALQDAMNDTKGEKVIPILIHGDAAFCGQGINQEVLNYSCLEGYRTGGTIHWVINNQIGFTTDPEESRSSMYASDIAKFIDAPILLVNGDDVEAVLRAAKIAFEYRRQFARDIVIDMYCYRRYGHNESDEPMFTQPLLYTAIENHPKVSQVLAKKMMDNNELDDTYLAMVEANYHELLIKALDTANNMSVKKWEKVPDKFQGRPPEYPPVYDFKPICTQVKYSDLEKIANTLTSVPDTFCLNPKIARQLEAKKKSFVGGEGIDWGFAESLAFGSLLYEGIGIRLSGQDCQRGTFSHRHAVYTDTKNNKKWSAYWDLNKDVNCSIYNSSLSEAGVLGFEYGYAINSPKTLVMWEAQFGDFANGAQVVIDQFIASGETKWMEQSSIVLLLPHGYMGQGPEHSSGRLERFLQLCADDNIQVCNLTTPAQYFHLLRKQAKQIWKKPLVLMTPKNLLRHKECVSSVDTLINGSFETVYTKESDRDSVSKLIICTGKIYYDLLQYRRDNNILGIGIVCIEQLYPLDIANLKGILESFKNIKKITWCQEEPKNMGAWTFLKPYFDELGYAVKYAGRPSAASPSTGKVAIHYLEHTQCMMEAFER